MILEQLVTAGTITELEIWRLRRRYRQIVGQRGADPEAGLPKVVSFDVLYLMSKPDFLQGSLRLGYFKPKIGAGEPVKSHLKLTIVDDEVTVLGSGNMDRASWFTSQELGLALLSKVKTGSVRDSAASLLQDRVEWVCK